MQSKVAPISLSWDNLKTQLLQTLLSQTLDKVFMSKLQENIEKVHSQLDTIIQIGKQMVQNEQNSSKIGRGGNNVAQNIKKAVLSLLKRKLPTNVYDQLQVRFIKAYNIKSQKQNLVLIFLFLEILHHEQKVQRRQINYFIREIKLKIEKYISNSKDKLQHEQQKTQFHQKNIKEFRKFLNIDLDFGRERDYEELKRQLDSFYLKKKLDFVKAEAKMRKIIEQFPCLGGIFFNFYSTKEINQSEIDPRLRQKSTLEEEQQNPAYIYY